MNRDRGSKPLYQIKIAKERINILFCEAEKIVSRDSALADRYAQLARKIGMRFNVRMPRELRRRFCRKCFSYLKPGVTCRQRTKAGKIQITCLKCGHINRYPMKKQA
ncbi:MAG: ribonuclease P [Candidatus Aenigmarchaeota archaeon]|nr:ribonuclease P [Candidatus Aenigmarchaeota archaeon]